MGSKSLVQSVIASLFAVVVTVGGGGSAAGSPGPLAAPAGTVTLEPTVIGTGAVCNGATGVWDVVWFLRPAYDYVTVVSAQDPVNGVAGVAATSFNFRISPGGTFPVSMSLPGSARTAALSASVRLDNGTAVTQSRTVDLGGGCGPGAPPPCMSGQSMQINFSLATNRAVAVIGGQCFKIAYQMLTRMPSPSGLALSYGAATAYTTATTTREVVAADLPPCQWVATVAGQTYSGGNGLCTHDSMTITALCGQLFTITLAVSADAVLPTTFLVTADPIGTQLVKLNPGQTRTLTVGPTIGAWVRYWGAQLGGAVWGPPTGGSC